MVKHIIGYPPGDTVNASGLAQVEGTSVRGESQTEVHDSADRSDDGPGFRNGQHGTLSLENFRQVFWEKLMPDVLLSISRN